MSLRSQKAILSLPQLYRTCTESRRRDAHTSNVAMHLCSDSYALHTTALSESSLFTSPHSKQVFTSLSSSQQPHSCATTYIEAERRSGCSCPNPFATTRQS